MKRTLLGVGIFLACYSYSGHAQLSNLVDAKFLVNTPSSIGGVKTITNSGSNNWGRAIDSFWFNVPVIKAHNIPVGATDGDSLACFPLDNGSGSNPSLAGSFALLYRSTCEFGSKALRAQTAGAIGVIIVNNIPGAPVGMGAGVDGASVTIPVVMVSQADGNAMNNAIRAGQPVRISISKWGFGFTNDMGVVGSSVPLPHAYALPKSQIGGTVLPTAYRNYTGGFVANFGTANQTNVRLINTVSFTPTGGSATVVRRDTLTDPSFTVADSLKLLYSASSFNLTSANTGLYTFSYNVVSNAVDNQPTDNSFTVPLLITDSLFSKGRVDNATGLPIATGGYRFGGTLAGNTMTWGPLYYNAKGGYNAAKVSFAIAAENTTTLGAEGTTFIYMYRWKDLNNDKLMTGSEMTLKGVAQKTYTVADSNYKINTVTLRVPLLNKAVVTEDSAWYWIAVECAPNQYMGCDFESNYFGRMFAAKGATSSITEYTAPQLQGSGTPSGTTLPGTSIFMMLPFQTATGDIDSVSFLSQKGLVPVAALHLSKNLAPLVGVESITTFKQVTLFPNPSVNHLVLNIELLRMSRVVNFSIIDAVGKNMLRRSSSDVQNGRFEFDLQGFPSGSYHLVIGTDDEVMARPFTIVR